MEKLKSEIVNEIFIRELDKEDLIPELIANYKRHQKVDRVIRWVDGEKVIVHQPFIEDWNPELLREIVEVDLKNCLKAGGAVFGAFYKNEIVAFSSLPNLLFGSEKQYLQLMQLHVSEEYRGLGLGKRLFTVCAEWARTMGASKLYISAHSSEETQLFYTSIGCVDAVEINQKLAQHEPCDIQMEYRL